METDGAGRERAKPSKRLLFDRRYGWVFDEWKEPSEEALAGGRGMFSILPLANALVKSASQSITLATSSAIKVLERPGEFSPQALHATLNNQLQKLMSSLSKLNFDPFNAKVNSPLLTTSCLEHLEKTTHIIAEVIVGISSQLLQLKLSSDEATWRRFLWTLSHDFQLKTKAVSSLNWAELVSYMNHSDNFIIEVSLCGQ